MLRQFFDSKKKTKTNAIIPPASSKDANIKLPAVDVPQESLQNRNKSPEELLEDFVKGATKEFARVGGIQFNDFAEHYKDQSSSKYALDNVSSDVRMDSSVVGGNNLTILFNGKPPFFAIQFSDMPAWHDELISKLSESGNPPHYFARTHGEPSSIKPVRFQPKPDDLNPFNQESRIKDCWLTC